MRTRKKFFKAVVCALAAFVWGDGVARAQACPGPSHLDPLGPAQIKAMHYNVQNLFDTVNDAGTDDGEFTPTGAQKWTEAVVRDKLRNLAEVIADENPDVLGITELENEAMLIRLKDAINGRLPASQKFKFWAVRGSDDGRGIRNAFISRFPIVDVKSHKIWREDSPWLDENGHAAKTRDILEMTVNTANCGAPHLVTFLENHWPSRRFRPGFDTAFLRMDAAKQLRGIVDALVREPAENGKIDRLVLSMGDMNDELADPSFAETLFPAPNLAALPTAPVPAFFAADSELSASEGTYYYNSDHKWNKLDHILISAGQDLLLGQTRGYHYQEGSLRVVRSRFVKEGQYPLGCEISRNQTRLRCENGASDHFPISAAFVLQ